MVTNMVISHTIYGAHQRLRVLGIYFGAIIWMVIKMEKFHHMMNQIHIGVIAIFLLMGLENGRIQHFQAQNSITTVIGSLHVIVLEVLEGAHIYSILSSIMKVWLIHNLYLKHCHSFLWHQFTFLINQKPLAKAFFFSSSCFSPLIFSPLIT